MSFSLRFARPGIDRRPGLPTAEAAPAEITTFVAFSRGLILGFVSAFLIFDLAMLQGATVGAVLRSLHHLVH
ncbi:MAG: hypothetical protein ACJ8DU_18460 [Microvirga sp.]|jgi:hypothetical protein|nr:hypothetical protein [Beijerinckiaceae bacterium]